MNPMWAKIDPESRGEMFPPCHCKIARHWRAEVFQHFENEFKWMIKADQGHFVGPIVEAISKTYPTAHDAMMACDLFVEAVTQ